MKKILIATDFSANAAHAAKCGYALAARLKTDVILCNAFIIPAEIPEGGALVWSQYDYDQIVKDNNEELVLFKNKLEAEELKGDFRPSINCISEIGKVSEVIDEIIQKYEVELVVMGVHGSSFLNDLLLGNHTRQMIDRANCPLLLVPASAEGIEFKKIAFAMDFHEVEKDLETIHKLVPILKKLNAELLLTHIYHEDDYTFKFQKHIAEFLVELSKRADYPNIYYRIVKSEKIERGLDWLCAHGHIDVLAMVHRKRSFLEKIVQASYTQKMAGHICVPLLVLPAD
jgi:nucleotide-binding universal stress UspA family protein